VDAHLVADGERVAHHSLRVVAGLVLARVQRGDQGGEGAVVGVGGAPQGIGQLGRLLAHASRQTLVVAAASQRELAAALRALDGADQVG